VSGGAEAQLTLTRVREGDVVTIALIEHAL
jgi:translation initiation factor IF-1